MTALAGDAATVSVFVAVTPEDAFDVFTTEIDLWWRQGPKYRIAGKRRGQLFFEGGTGGRMFETFETSAGSRTFEVGKVLVWDPPRRLELEWRGVNFKPGEITFVEVSFQPSGEGTMVTVRHRGWAALRDDHPVRHGLAGPAFIRMIGMFWGELMTSLREHVAAKVNPPEDG
ncbi:MAG: SRPBCC domain-containing protein [Minicystis sp.]